MPPPWPATQRTLLLLRRRCRCSCLHSGNGASALLCRTLRGCSSCGLLTTAVCGRGGRCLLPRLLCPGCGGSRLCPGILGSIHRLRDSIPRRLCGCIRSICCINGSLLGLRLCGAVDGIGSSLQSRNLGPGCRCSSLQLACTIGGCIGCRTCGLGLCDGLGSRALRHLGRYSRIRDHATCSSIRTTALWLGHFMVRNCGCGSRHAAQHNLPQQRRLSAQGAAAFPGTCQCEVSLHHCQVNVVAPGPRLGHDLHAAGHVKVRPARRDRVVARGPAANAGDRSWSCPGQYAQVSYAQVPTPRCLCPGGGRKRTAWQNAGAAGRPTSDSSRRQGLPGSPPPLNRLVVVRVAGDVIRALRLGRGRSRHRLGRHVASPDATSGAPHDMPGVRQAAHSLCCWAPHVASTRWHGAWAPPHPPVW